MFKGFPGGSVVKNSAANAGEMGSVPGRSQIPRDNEACVPQPLRPACPESVLCNKGKQCNPRKPACSTKTQHGHKIKKSIS